MKKQNALYFTLKNTSFWVPCYQKEDKSITFEVLLDRRRQKYIPLFFRKESPLGNFNPERMIYIAFPTLRNIFIDLHGEISGMVIEPFQENILLNNAELSIYDTVTQGMTVERQSYQNFVKLEPVTSLPEGFAAALRDFFSQQSGVNKVWAVTARRTTEADSHLMIVISFSGSKLELFPKLAEVIQPFMEQGQQFELIPKNESLEVEQIDGALIYEKKGMI